MVLAPLPTVSRVRWHRLDVPGREESIITQLVTGWLLTGELAVEEAGSTFELRYAIECDAAWCTRMALVEGLVDAAPLRVLLAADGKGNWWHGGASLPELTGALDIDLGFTPATNTLPIRRLDLGIGESAPVTSAWLRFPGLRLEPLEQTYTRQAERSFRYRAWLDEGPFVAHLHTDEFGRVMRYEDLWQADFTATE